MTDRVSSALIEHPVRPELWMLDPNVTFLNHGSFGSCPRSVLENQNEIRDRLESQPVDFFVRDLEPLLDEARSILASFVGAESEDIVFVPNATSGVNTVLRSLTFQQGNELLVTDQEYNACRNALDFVANCSRARVVVARIPFPVSSEDEIVQAVLELVSDRTKLVMLDHVTSQTGLVMPIKRIADELSLRGIDLLVDGAHAPGMVPLNLSTLGATYYTGNCHKWLCTPKTAALLYVRRDKQSLIRPLSISHGANSPRSDRSRFLIEFGWTGTSDPSAYLCVPKAIECVGSLLPNGWQSVMARNRTLALEARRLLCDALEVSLPCPDELIGSLASIPLSDGKNYDKPRSPLYLDPLQDLLRNRYSIEVPIIPWPSPPKRLIRISAQLYNALPQYRVLGDALQACLTI